ncbi:hypothetical protein [Spiroplasma eriocheiris]|uniref:Uncharacterized protein n=1 Tax=Spiroplasma eriocheiris TaxID=315358 RepID=A0A0H3XJI3_9MOLU|nr:hypothetical protein [Spiroplasma eriocheiris]AHF57554.1 hypothetical protein SPE_0425 [Spiroplasma eriocheiris CCTCC M 207170]AKM54011.1 hypothetical protein SERIO_v1c04320 [Spiroplasma eriocheiris]
MVNNVNNSQQPVRSNNPPASVAPINSNQPVTGCFKSGAIISLVLASLILVFFLMFGLVGVVLNILDKTMNINQNLKMVFSLAASICYLVIVIIEIPVIILNQRFLNGKDPYKYLIAIIDILFAGIIGGIVILFGHFNNKQNNVQQTR